MKPTNRSTSPGRMVCGMPAEGKDRTCRFKRSGEARYASDDNKDLVPVPNSLLPEVQGKHFPIKSTERIDVADSTCR